PQRAPLQPTLGCQRAIDTVDSRAACALRNALETLPAEAVRPLLSLSLTMRALVVAVLLCACEGQITTPLAVALPPPVPPADDPLSRVPASGARRLSAFEYDAVLRDLLDDTTGSGLQRLPGDQPTPFDNDSHTQEVSTALLDALESLAID